MKAVLTALLLCLVIMNAAEARGHGGPLKPRPSYSGQWFADNSPWNVPITSNIETGYSLSVFEATGRDLNINSTNFTPGVVYANSATDTLQNVVLCRKLSENANCNQASPVGSFYIRQIDNVPIPIALIQYAQQCTDTDCSVCVYDANRDGFYIFWKATYSGGVFAAQVGRFNKMSDIGWGNGIGGATSNPCGGVIKRRELEAGYIPHAVRAGFPKDFNGSTYVFPATSSDGTATTDSTHPPQGSLLQLDPDLTDAQLQALGCTGDLLTIAHAMQKYGLYVVESTDNMPSPAAMIVEDGATAIASPFCIRPSDTYYKFKQPYSNPTNAALDVTNEHDSYAVYSHIL